MNGARAGDGSLPAVSASLLPRASSGRARARARRSAAIAIAAAGVSLASAVAAWTFWPRPPLGDACGTRALCARDCERKDLAACVALGGLQWTGAGGARDLDAATASFGAACDGGKPRGCLELAHLYEDATGLAAKAPLAADLRRRAVVGYEKRCEARDARETHDAPHACLVAGSLYASGRGVNKSTPRANELYARGRAPLERECASGSALACARLSYACARGLGGPKDNVKSLEIAERACHLGDVSSCMLAGGLYAEGPGIREVPKDAARAPASYRRACELGEARACHALARLLDDGNAATANAPEALALEKKACEAELAPACAELGQMTLAGIGGAASPKAAAPWFARDVLLREKGCASGSGDDCAALAENHRRLGHGVKIDGARADELGERAALLWQQGCDAGQWSECLAMRLYLEKETPPDAKQIRALRERECALGYEHTCKRLGAGMPPPRP